MKKKNFIENKLFPILACMVLLISSMTVFVYADSADYTLSGEWKFNDTVDTSVDMLFNDITYISGDLTHNNMVVNHGNLVYLKGLELVYDGYYWLQEIGKYLDFGTTPQAVSEEFYTWFTANAVSQGGIATSPTPTAEANVLDDDNGIFAVFATAGTWIAEAVTDTLPMFYDNGLTFVGVIAVAGLALSVCFLIIALIRRFISFGG